MKRKFRLVYTLLGLIALIACQKEEKRVVPDVSDIVVDLEIRRFEKDLFSLNTEIMEAGLTALEKTYPKFSEIYFNQVLPSKKLQFAPEGHVKFMEGFIKHPSVQQLYDTTMALYDNMELLKKDFEQAFRYYKYYFPDRVTPDITTFISEYSVGTFIYDQNSLALGLDFFLGSDFPYGSIDPYNPGFSDYLTRAFDRDHMVAKALRVLIDDLLGEVKGDRLLDKMIHNGKRLYILDHLLPNTPDSVKLEMTQKQVQWLSDNEFEMWAFFLQEDLLYSSKGQDIREYVDYSPRSPGMPAESPGRTGNWVGWQIIKAFMARSPEYTMSDLLTLTDAQEILNKSRYKPRR